MELSLGRLGPSASGWEVAELVMTVQEPVLVAATVEGNALDGARHIPGWCLMPEVARRLGGPAHALARAGGLVVTAATPLSERGEPTLPVPRVLMHAKGTPGTITGNALYDDPDGHPCQEGYITAGGTLVLPEMCVRVYSTGTGRGEDYTCRALAAGVRLRAEVRVRAGVLPAGWEASLAGMWKVGRSSTDDYGKVCVKARPATPPAPGPPHGPGAGGVLRVWLLSDLLVRDERLRASVDPADAARALQQALAAAGAPGVRLAPVRRAGTIESAPGSANPKVGGIAEAMGVGRIDDWHHGWGLPRPTLCGLAAGSCLTFTVDGGALSAEALAEVRMAGVGERRGEGFGQVEFDHPLLQWRPSAEAGPRERGEVR